MPKRVHRKRMSKRGGYVGQEYVEGATDAVGKGLGAANSVVTDYVVNPVTGAAGVVVEKTKEGAQGANTGFWSLFGYGNPSAPPAVVPAAVPVVAVAPVPAQGAVVGGSRRRRKKNGRKSKTMFSGLMNMMGLKTKKRGRKGGIGGPSNGYQHIVGANFPSAANAQGNTIYDLAPFDPSKPFTGGCMPSKSISLSPAPYPSDSLMGGKSRRNRKPRGGTKKW
jgi:hypothetical protein